VLLNLAVVLGVAGPFVFFGHQLPMVQIIAGAGVLILGHVALAALIEGKPWAVALDWLRIVGVAAVAGWLVGTAMGPTVGVAVASGLLVVSLASRLVLRPRVVVPASAQ
jgi:hypothetical protein